MADDLVKMKEQVYKDPRPAEYFTRFHEQARRRPPNGMYELVRLVLSPIVWLFYRGRAIRSDRVPDSGSLIIAPNHFSFLDHFFVAAFLRRKVHFMAKSQLFFNPTQFVYRHGGVFPVRRGARDEEAFVTARTVLERGNTMVMYCEGGRSRTGDVSTEAKPGIGRIALQTGAPIVPVAIFGSQKVRNWKRLQIPKVTVLYGEPIQFPKIAEPTREQQQAVADAVLLEIRRLFAEVKEQGRAGTRKQERAARREGAATTA
jgi:1-acyl-sn-glycerol-3-phosphate acyltransferase